MFCDSCHVCCIREMEKIRIPVHISEYEMRILGGFILYIYSFFSFEEEGVELIKTLKNYVMKLEFFVDNS